jgi:hypothetical protein
MREGCKQLRAPCTFFPTAFSRSGAEDWLLPWQAGRAVRYTNSTGRYNMISLPRGGPVQFDFSRPSLLLRASTTIILRYVATVGSRTGTNGPVWLLSCCTFGQGHEQNVAFRYRIQYVKVLKGYLLKVILFIIKSLCTLTLRS